MKVKEFIELMKTKDQEADVMVVESVVGQHYWDVKVYEVDFDSKIHLELTEQLCGKKLLIGAVGL